MLPDLPGRDGEGDDDAVLDGRHGIIKKMVRCNQRR
jgi:hypothetical protein